MRRQIEVFCEFWSKNGRNSENKLILKWTPPFISFYFTQSSLKISISFQKRRRFEFFFAEWSLFGKQKMSFNCWRGNWKKGGAKKIQIVEKKRDFSHFWASFVNSVAITRSLEPCRPASDDIMGYADCFPLSDHFRPLWVAAQRARVRIKLEKITFRFSEIKESMIGRTKAFPHLCDKRIKNWTVVGEKQEGCYQTKFCLVLLLMLLVQSMLLFLPLLLLLLLLLLLGEAMLFDAFVVATMGVVAVDSIDFMLSLLLLLLL